MKAVFEKYPYKFWVHGGGTMHLFDDDKVADEFAARLRTEYDASPTHDPRDVLVIDTPSPNPECATTWAHLVCDYASCCGWEKVVLHSVDRCDDADVDFITWSLDVAFDRDCELDDHIEVDWDWTYEDARIANFRLDKDVRKSAPYPLAEALVCDLLFELYDVSVKEIYDWDGDYTGEIANNWKEMIDYRELVTA